MQRFHSRRMKGVRTVSDQRWVEHKYSPGALVLRRRFAKAGRSRIAGTVPENYRTWKVVTIYRYPGFSDMIGLHTLLTIIFPDFGSKREGIGDARLCRKKEETERGTWRRNACC